MTTVTTTTSVTLPNGYWNQQRIVRLTSRRLVAVIRTVTSPSDKAEIWHSNDNGATWTHYSTGDILGWLNGSIATFVDGSGTERLIATWKQNGAGGSRTSGNTYTMAATFSVDELTLTWGAALDQGAGGGPDRYSMVAHPEGAGGKVHFVGDFASFNAVYYFRLNVTSAGVLSTDVAGQLLSDGPSDGNNANPMVALNPSTKDVYVGWTTMSAGAGGSGKGVRFMKLAYSAGPTWTAGTEREIDTTRYVNASNAWLRCLFDGTRVVLVGNLFDGTNYDLVVYERDAGDTATTTRVLQNDEASNIRLDFGSASFDSAGNLYIFGVNQDEADASKDLVYRLWTRATLTLGGENVIDATVGDAVVTAKVGYSGGYIDFFYRDLVASPFNLVYGNVFVDVAPTAATWVTAAGVYDQAANLALAWLFADPDVGDVETAYALKRVVRFDLSDHTSWWRASDSTWQTGGEVKNTTSATAVSLPSLWDDSGTYPGGSVTFFVKTWDINDQPGVYSAGLAIVPSVKVNPTLNTPAAGATIASSSLTAAWTVASESQFRLELLDAAGTTTLYDSGWVVDSSSRVRTIPYVLAESTTYKLRLTTKNADGLTSDSVTHTFTAAYTPPSTPTLVNTPTGGKIVVAITNPAPSGGHPLVTSQDLYKRRVGTSGSGDPVQAGLANGASYDDYEVASGVAYEYLVIAHAANGISASSAWTS